MKTQYQSMQKNNAEYPSILNVSAFVDGKPLLSSSNDRLDLFNPASGEKSMSIPADCDADAERAVVSSRLAFDDSCWRLAKHVRAGSISVYATTPAGEDSGVISCEPYGLSGIGVEGGLAGMEAYIRRQVAWFNHG